MQLDPAIGNLFVWGVLLCISSLKRKERLHIKYTERLRRSSTRVSLAFG